MSLIIATGSNLGEKKKYLELALTELLKKFCLIKKSPIFESEAVDFSTQPSFYNQVLEFKLPSSSPMEVLEYIMSIESKLGRTRIIDKGPRTIDIDILFWSLHKFNNSKLCIPHPRWDQRSFVVKPLQHLPFFETIKKHYIIPTHFEVDAKPID